MKKTQYQFLPGCLVGMLLFVLCSAAAIGQREITLKPIGESKNFADVTAG
jgi:hypothetical protein